MTGLAARGAATVGCSSSFFLALLCCSCRPAQSPTHRARAYWLVFGFATAAVHDLFSAAQSGAGRAPDVGRAGRGKADCFRRFFRP